MDRAICMHRKGALKRGLHLFMSLSSGPKIEIARKWHERQLLILTYGAWVRDIADREETLLQCRRGDDHYFRKLSSATLRSFNEYVSTNQKMQYYDEIAVCLRKLLCFRKGFVMLNRFIPSFSSTSTSKNRQNRVNKFVASRQEQDIGKYFKILHYRVSRRLAIVAKKLNRRTDCGRRARQSAAVVFGQLRRSIHFKTTYESNMRVATTHFRQWLLRKGVGA